MQFGGEYYKDSTQLFNNRVSASSLTASSHVIYPLEKVVRKALLMFHSKAFLHQYKKFNINELAFEHAFIAAECLIKDYKEIL